MISGSKRNLWSIFSESHAAILYTYSLRIHQPLEPILLRQLERSYDFAISYCRSCTHSSTKVTRSGELLFVRWLSSMCFNLFLKGINY